jgi:triosephosphate isomerase (TIM)
MRKPLVAANWKMHGSDQFLETYFPALEQAIDSDKVEVVIFPPAVYLQKAAGLCQQLQAGAQDVSQHSEGAFTGEVSATMVSDVGCRYVLVGHSERRIRHRESSKTVAEKFLAAVGQGLVPVLCVGESLEEREANRTLAVVQSQIQSVIDLAGLEQLTNAVIAYEPVWAIGTGKTASPEQAQEVHRAIRDMLGPAGQHTRIVYGGSVKAENAMTLFNQPDIDGGLVGGASLKVDEFAAICGSV